MFTITSNCNISAMNGSWLFPAYNSRFSVLGEQTNSKLNMLNRLLYTSVRYFLQCIHQWTLASVLHSPMYSSFCVALHSPMYTSFCMCSPTCSSFCMCSPTYASLCMCSPMYTSFCSALMYPPPQAALPTTGVWKGCLASNVHFSIFSVSTIELSSSPVLL